MQLFLVTRICFYIGFVQYGPEQWVRNSAEKYEDRRCDKRILDCDV